MEKCGTTEKIQNVIHSSSNSGEFIALLSKMRQLLGPPTIWDKENVLMMK
jgi:hypothetical protein